MEQLNLLLAAVAGILSSAVVGIVKRLEETVDVRIVTAIKPVTPLLVTALAFVLPKLATTLHLTAIPDAQALANAPLAAIIGIVARELLVKIQKPAS